MDLMQTKMGLYSFTLKGKTQELPLRIRPEEELHADKYLREKILGRMRLKSDESGKFAVKLVKELATL